MPAVGVTGTNGKTSTVLLLAAALGARGELPPTLTTLGFFARGKRFGVKDHAAFVTAMKREYDAGARRCVLEMTSLTLANGGALAWPFAGAVFTNLSHDHLDQHKSAEHYLASKAQLFLHLKEGAFAVLNADDPASALIEEVLPAGITVRRYGTSDLATDRIESVATSWQGTRVTMEQGAVIDVPLIGAHFGQNAVAAWIAAQLCGVDADSAARGIANAKDIPGRFEVVRTAPHVVVDFAHSPDALTKTLATARELANGTRIFVVFGAAGGTDPSHRPAFGNAAALADRIILTNDNPRHEDPAAIIAQLREGLRTREVAVEHDRGKAIALALSEASPNDVVVIAGKGHERGQLIGTEMRPWSDRAFVIEWMAKHRST